MSDLCRLIWCALIGLFRSRASLEAEILVLRHQLNVSQHSPQMSLADDQNMIQALTPKRADQAFSVWVLPRRPR
jgi:hypothetical protein